MQQLVQRAGQHDYGNLTSQYSEIKAGILRAMRSVGHKTPESHPLWEIVGEWTLALQRHMDANALTIRNASTIRNGEDSRGLGFWLELNNPYVKEVLERENLKLK